MSKQTIEGQTASAILQKKRQIQVGAFTFDVAPPTTATLILASELISTFPSEAMKGENIAGEVLAEAEHYKALGDLASLLIIGAKNLKQTSRFNPFAYFYKRKQRKLAKRILQELSPKELYSLIAEILKGMEVVDFFAITTFLSEINILKAKKKVETTETTAFGQ